MKFITEMAENSPPHDEEVVFGLLTMVAKNNVMIRDFIQHFENINCCDCGCAGKGGVAWRQ